MIGKPLCVFFVVDSIQLATRRWLTWGKKLSASFCISRIPKVQSILFLNDSTVLQGKTEDHDLTGIALSDTNKWYTVGKVSPNALQTCNHFRSSYSVTRVIRQKVLQFINSAGKLFHSSITLIGKKYFLISKWTTVAVCDNYCHYAATSEFSGCIGWVGSEMGNVPQCQ